MIKAYINNGIITVTAGKKSVSYPVGSGAVSLTGKFDFENPYAFFEDYDKASLASFAKTELSKLVSLDGFSIDTLAEFDSARKNKLYISKNFSMSFEFLDVVLSCFVLTSAKDLFALEIIMAATLGKPLKICENCGEYFFPSGRADSVYCDRITETGYTCKKIGAHRQYRKNSRLSDIKKLYDKVTKHNRYLKSKGTLSSYEYSSWMSTASSQYADFKAGNLSAAEFEAWLLGKETAPTKRAKSRSSISDYLL